MSCPSKKKFQKEQTVSLGIHCLFRRNIEKGNAEKVPSEELEKKSEKVWNISHHGMHHPKIGSLRVVFDCLASLQGASLNSKLIQCPNLISRLVGVLLHFRQEPVALMVDIESMFYQVRVAGKHKDILSFLWWPSQLLQEYRTTVHLFGASSSPSCPGFALRQTQRISETSHLTVETDKHKLYVNDCLKSVATEADAGILCKELEAACAMGGFSLHKWFSLHLSGTFVPGIIVLAKNYQSTMSSCGNSEGQGEVASESSSVCRCIKPKGFGQITSAQLHHFSNASGSGYGCVSYLRLVNTKYEVHTSFIMEKSWVAPLKQTTMSRLELITVVLAVRLDRLLKTELQFTLKMTQSSRLIVHQY